MAGRGSRWAKVPMLVYASAALGGLLGAWVGNTLCLGYDILYGPWGPQAGVDPNPAGWVGWWVAGGAGAGAAAGLVASVILVAVCQVAGWSRRRAEVRPGTRPVR
jgi:hypothetical protein